MMPVDSKRHRESFREIAAGYKPRWPHRLQAYVPKKIAPRRKILDDRSK
jgi:hypothetical protein